MTGCDRLKSITINNGSLGSANTISFDNDHYFLTSGDTSEFGKRLKLHGVSFLGENSEAQSLDNQLRKYSFEYDETIPLPSRSSTAQDYWGYYNGKSNTQLLIPNDDSFPNYRHYNLGNRETDFLSMKAGILEEVIYPTGGKTVYTYNLNTAPPRFSDYTDTVTYGNDAINGFIDASDPANYLSCDDESNLPTLSTESFSIPDSASRYDIKLDITGSSTSYSKVFYAFVYRGAQMTFCDIINDINSPNVVYKYLGGGVASNYSDEVSLNLDPRYTYHIMLELHKRYFEALEQNRKSYLTRHKVQE